MGRYDRPLVYTYTEPLFGGALTDGGVQYCPPGSGTISLQDAYGTAYWGTISAKMGGSILWTDLALVAELRGVGATADVTIQWRAKNKGAGTVWVNLHPEIAYANIGTTLLSKVVSGYYAPEANFNTLPYEIQLLVKSTEPSGAIYQLTNSGYAKTCFETVDDMTISA